MFDEQMMEDLLEEKEITEEAIHAAIKKGVNSLEFVPVYLGSAFKIEVYRTIGRRQHLPPSPLEASVNVATVVRGSDEEQEKVELKCVQIMTLSPWHSS